VLISGVKVTLMVPVL